MGSVSQTASTPQPDAGDVDTHDREVPPPPPPRRRGMSGTARNIAYSTLAVLVICFAWWALIPQGDDVPRGEVQTGPTLDFAVTSVDWDVWAPEGLGADWTAEQAGFSTLLEVPENLRLGYRAPDGSFVGIDRAVDVGTEWNRVLLTGVAQDGTMLVNGPGGTQDWQVWRSDDGGDKVALALPGEGQEPSTVVRGDGDLQTLVTFIESLAVQGP